jgi:hypothetical protein
MALQFPHRQLPDSIKNAPELLPGLSLYLTGFFDLTADRQLGFGSVGAIPFTAIVRYCELYDLDDETTETFIFHIRKMDQAYIAHEKSKQPSK